ncbi:MAG TPA: glycoside hydrolase family 3 N-terminal domain-containing protein [Gemmatimonadaceae bacterium]|nr:glycoside hydrolase family 3 N-terminal domain-containing protein [Gemmatimonadaceae bacterium]
MRRTYGRWPRLPRLSLCAAVLLATRAGAQQPYKNPRLPVEVRVRDLLGRMTVDEKFWQLFMIPGGRGNPADDYSHGVFGLQTRSAATARSDAELQNALQHYFVDSTRLGIPIIPFEEGVHGLMRHGATVYPAAIALAATFDSALVSDVATAIAREARARGIRQLLSPVVNLATDVRWGRVEETYGEDPWLASVMSRAFVRQLEEHDVIATPKHFVANVGEGGRDSYPIDASARQLEERVFPPFRASLVDAGARSVMTAYNSVNGIPASQNRALLRGTLKNDWGFKGFIISDQSAVGGAVVLQHTEANIATATEHALNAGLDVIFQSSWREFRPYLAAFRSGAIAPSVMDSAVARVLRAKFQLGLFEHPYVNVDSAAVGQEQAQARLLARQAARESIVLLRNDPSTLPLSSSVGSIAVIGMDAAEARLGGYTLDSVRAVSILDGLRARLGDRVRYAPGPGRSTSDYAVVPEQYLDSLRGEYFDNIALEGMPRVTRADRAIDFHWTFNAPAPAIPVAWYSVRWKARLRAPDNGVRRIGVEGNDGYRLYLDGKLLIDNWRKESYRVMLMPLALSPGSVHDLRLEFFESAGNARVRLVWDATAPNDAQERIDSAIALARRSDAAIVVAGIEEGEFRDRASLSLPGRQEDLILRVAALGKPVVVVLVGGSAITMSRWVDRVGAVVMAWYPGAEGGHAVADVLLGDVSPSGRLPVTFPIAEGQLPLRYDHEPTGRGDDYVDLTGQPAFPFGFGLSYTRFAYDRLRIEPQTLRPAGQATITFRIRNVGGRAGDEIPQLYVRRPLSPVAQPVLALKGVGRIHLASGEEREVTFPLAANDLRILDEQLRWSMPTGTATILIGASSNDIRLRGQIGTSAK